MTPIAVLAQKLSESHSDWQINYIGAYGDKVAKNKIGDNLNFTSYKRIFSGKFRRYVGFRGKRRLKLWKAYLFNLRDMLLVTVGLLQAMILLIANRPNVVFSKGGYPALPVCIAAGLLRVPIVSHDSDAVPGLTHRICGRFISTKLFGVPPSNPGPSRRHVGVPIESDYAHTLTSAQKASVKRSLGISTDSTMILVTGGGLGSTSLNLAVARLTHKYSENEKVVFVVITGEANLESFKREALESKRVIAIGFSEDMKNLMRTADIVITRAGATVLAEVSASSTAAIIIPNSQLPGSHQLHNAAVFKESGSAIVLQVDKNVVDEDDLKKALDSLLADPAKRKLLGKSVGKMYNSTTLDQIEQAIVEQIR